MSADYTLSVSSEGKNWICKVCFHVYAEETAFEDLAEDWSCPVCGAPKNCFVCRPIEEGKS